jgi:hypothetical protein
MPPLSEDLEAETVILSNRPTRSFATLLQGGCCCVAPIAGWSPNRSTGCSLTIVWDDGAFGGNITMVPLDAFG